MSEVAKLVRVTVEMLNHADGREKITKMVQFVIQYYVLWGARLSGDKFARLGKFTSYLSSSRRVFKMFRVLEDCYSYPNALRQPSTPAGLCIMARASLSIVTDFIYDVATAAQIGVIKSNYDSLMRVHDFFWFFASASDFFYQILQHAKATSPTQQFLVELDILKAGLYMCMAASNKQFKYWLAWEGFLVCGLISTAISLYKIGAKVRQKLDTLPRKVSAG